MWILSIDCREHKTPSVKTEYMFKLSESMPNIDVSCVSFSSVEISSNFHFKEFRGSRPTKYKYLFSFRRFFFHRSCVSVNTNTGFTQFCIADSKLSIWSRQDISVWLARPFWALLTSCFIAKTLQQRWDLIWHKSIGMWRGDIWSVFLEQKNAAMIFNKF